MPDGLNRYWLSGDRTENLKRIFLLYILVLCITHYEVHQYLKILLGFVCIVGILFKDISKHPIFWGLVSGMLIFNLLFRYSISSNHYFLVIFTAMAVFIQSLRSQQELPSKINPYRSLIIITMGLATLQKLLSSYFLSGKLLATYILGGGSFYHLIAYVDPGHVERVNLYYETLLRIKEQPFTDELPIAIPEGNFLLACVVLSVLIVASELILFFLCVYKRSYYNPLFVWVLMGFVWITFIFRQEYSFFALLLILFLLSNKDVRKVPDLIIKSSITILLILDLAFWIF